ncbi:MAG: hypothetical protein HY054_01950 [Proteobacteria bacterium]|nr:hypothetical protein [Pseudomonadota bacterium]
MANWRLEPKPQVLAATSSGGAKIRFIRAFRSELDEPWLALWRLEQGGKEMEFYVEENGGDPNTISSPTLVVFEFPKGVTSELSNAAIDGVKFVIRTASEGRRSFDQAQISQR